MTTKEKNVIEQPTLTVIVPCYNEQATIKQTIEELLKDTYDGILQIRITKQIIIVDDGSTDQSPQIIDEYKNVPNIKIIHKTRNPGGKGTAIKVAIPYCTGKYVIIQDADLEYKPLDYPLMLYPASLGFKAIFGSRRMNPYNERNQSSSPLFYLGGNILTRFANLLYGTKHSDAWTGYKCIELNLLKELDLQSDGFEICAETVAKLAQKRIDVFTVPIHFFPRKLQEGKKIRVGDGFKIAKTLLKYKIDTTKK